MAGNLNYQDKTNADKTSIGFDYQFYYFVNILLNMKIGQKIGYEVKDDIHIDLDQDNTVLIQTKHTLKTNKQGNTVNLTERDGDLWKTLYNWLNVINDKEEKRTTVLKQMKFIESTKFILVSNKNNNMNNKFLDIIKNVQEGTYTVTEFRDYLKKLLSESKTKDSNNKVNIYIDALVSQSDEWLQKFIFKIEFILSQDDLIQQIRNTIRTKLFEFDEDRITDALNCIISNLSIWKYESVKGKEKIYITYEEVEKKLHKCFLNARKNKLPKRKFDFNLPNNLEDQIFIKQLVDIDGLDPTDIVQMADYTTNKLNILKHIEVWKQAGFITEDELQDFNDECIALWKNYYVASHRTSRRISDNLDSEKKFETIKNNALNCLDNILQKTLKFDDEDLSIQMSNGQFFYLSDILQIGWLLDWEERYK